MIYCYLYTGIPGSGKGWTLAVFAVSRKDADLHVKNYFGGGRFVNRIDRGKVNADCGATTTAASIEIREG